MQELLGGRGELQFLGAAGISGPVGTDLLHGGLAAIFETHEYSGHVTVLAGHAEALGGDGQIIPCHNFAVLQEAEDFQRFLLAFFFFAADVGDAVVHHLGPAVKGFSCAGNRLVGTHQDIIQTVLQQGSQGRDIALDRAVGLDGNEALFCAQALSLGIDHTDVVCIDFRHHHGHICCPAVGAVVGYYRYLQPGIALFQGADVLFLHVHGTEDKVDLGGQSLCIGLGVQHHQIPGGRWNRPFHSPAACYGIFVALSGAGGAGSHGNQLKPGMVFQQCNKTLADHARTSDNSYAILFHDAFLQNRTGIVLLREKTTNWVEKAPRF